MNDKKTVNLTDLAHDKKLKDLLEFPCDFTFKVVGAARPDLVDDVVQTVHKTIKGDYTPSTKESGKGTYHSVSINVRAENIEQLEKLYKELAEINGVRMVL